MSAVATISSAGAASDRAVEARRGPSTRAASQRAAAITIAFSWVSVASPVSTPAPAIQA